MNKSLSIFWLALALVAGPAAATAQTTKPGGKTEWEATVESAKKEGKVVVSIPASAELRKLIEEAFAKRFPIELELVPARGTAIITRIANETKAGVRNFDIHIGGSNSVVSGLLAEGILEPFEPYLILPEVKDPKQWWGGHMWVDRAKRYIYSFQAYLTESTWRNETLANAEEFRSYDDLLNPKWRGKIGILDPRTPGAGDSSWA